MAFEAAGGKAINVRQLLGAIGWTATKAVFLFTAVLIGLRLGLEFVLRKLNALNHLDSVRYVDWLQMSLAITAAMLFFVAFANWVLRREIVWDDDWWEA